MNLHTSKQSAEPNLGFAETQRPLPQAQAEQLVTCCWKQGCPKEFDMSITSANSWLLVKTLMIQHKARSTSTTWVFLFFGCPLVGWFKNKPKKHHIFASGKTHHAEPGSGVLPRESTTPTCCGCTVYNSKWLTQVSRGEQNAQW